MTRRDYELIAVAIRDASSLPNTDPITAGHIRRAVADALEADNPRFDRALFLHFARPDLAEETEAPR